jgi:hypothetical protein
LTATNKETVRHDLLTKFSKSITESDEFEWLAKVVYFTNNMDAIKKDPELWQNFPHDKQVELHRIKKELDKHFATGLPDVGFSTF